MVSIIIPCYNSEKYLANCIDSVLAQTYKKIEVICVNDGSTDSTEKILLGYGNKIRTFSKKNGGTASARNLGIKNASGKYIAFLDSDDMLTPNSVELRRKMFDVFDPDIVSGLSSIITDNNMTEKTKEGKLVHSPTGMIKAEHIDRFGGFNEKIRFNEDREFWARMLLIHKLKMIKIGAPVAFYRIHSNNKRNHMSEQKRKEAALYCDKVLRDQGITDFFCTDISVDIKAINYGFNTHGS